MISLLYIAFALAGVMHHWYMSNCLFNYRHVWGFHHEGIIMVCLVLALLAGIL